MSAENTNDLSKIIGVIMEHPEIIEEISRLAGTKKEPEEPTVTAPAEPEEPEAVSEAVSARASVRDSRKRSQLLYALKPYLSERRSRAIDSMLTFGEVFDMMKSGKER